MSAQVLVHIIGGYDNDSEHKYDRKIWTEAPAPDGLDDWWDEVIYPETGDAVHDNSGSYCDATIVDVIDGDADLVGETREWIDEANKR